MKPATELEKNLNGNRLHKALESFEVMTYGEDDDGFPTKAAVVIWGPTLEDIYVVFEAAWGLLDGKTLKEVPDVEED